MIDLQLLIMQTDQCLDTSVSAGRCVENPFSSNNSNNMCVI